MCFRDELMQFLVDYSTTPAYNDRDYKVATCIGEIAERVERVERLADELGRRIDLCLTIINDRQPENFTETTTS